MALCTWADGNAHVHLHIGFVHSQVNFFFFLGPLAHTQLFLLKTTCYFFVYTSAIFLLKNVLVFCFIEWGHNCKYISTSLFHPLIFFSTK